MLFKKGDNFIVSGSWFSGSYGWNPNLKELMSNSGSGIYTVTDIETLDAVNENSYPALYAEGAEKRVSYYNELDPTGSYLISHYITMLPSGSDIKSDEAKSNGLKLWSSGSHQEWQVIVDNNT